MTYIQPLLPLLTCCLLWACTPQFSSPETVTTEPRLKDAAFITFDGTELPLNTWLPPEPLKAVFIGLHGYNDYSFFINEEAHHLTDRGIGIYAYDQRGFGQTLNRGKWSGHEAMCEDLRTIISLVKKRHSDIPLYLLGDSMGGAVVMVADKPDNPLPVEGVVLIAPAVWSRTSMPFYQRWMLWLASRTVPWIKLTADGLDITPSDNKEMLKALGRDPLVIKESRVDAIYGLVNLMDAAYEAASYFNRKTLFLYGVKDEIIPPEPIAHVYRQRLNGEFSNPQRLLVYKNGYHMLLRDLQAEVVWKDILFWINSPSEPFPSVREMAAQEITREEDITTYIYPASADDFN